MDLEKKFHEGGLEVQKNCVIGYASLFDKPDQQGDVVKRGAFAKSLAERGVSGVKMLWQHDPAKPIGIWTRIEEDAQGLLVEGTILDAVEQGREALALLEAGAVSGLSIGYRTLISGNAKSSGRILKSVDLWEISIVTFPMLNEARAELRSQKMSEASLQAFERAASELRLVLTTNEY